MKSRLLGVGFALALFVAGGMSASALAGAASVSVKPGTATQGAFPPAEECGCHAQRVNEWRASPHAKALDDPAFVYKVAEADKATNGALGPFCKTCHAPAAAMVGAFSAKTEPTGGPAQGVGCAFCHSVTGTSQPIANTSQLVDPGATRRAQLKEPKAPHPAAYSAFHESAEFCGACHNVNHPINGMHLEATYAEWLASPYAKEGVTCQNCHMGDQPGNSAPVTGVAAGGGPQRDNIFYMNFIGANVALGDPVLAKKNLEYAATLELDVPPVVEPGTDAELAVTVTNVGAGHYLPTGLTEVREMWLEIVRVDEAGKEQIIGERRFGTILEDDKGNAPVELWVATKIKSDDRIAPRESVTVSAPVNMQSANEAYMIEARLKYRSLSDEFAEGAKMENPTTVMATAKKAVFGSAAAQQKGYSGPTAEEEAQGISWGPIAWVGVIVLVVAIGAFAFLRAKGPAE